MSSITTVNHIHYHAGRLQAAADILLAIADNTGTSAIAELIQDSAGAILLADTICSADLPEAPSIPPQFPPSRPVDPEEIQEELALGEVTTVPEAVSMLLASNYTAVTLAAAIGCRPREITWAANETRVTKAIKDYFRPLLPQTAESETPGEL